MGYYYAGDWAGQRTVFVGGGYPSGFSFKKLKKWVKKTTSKVSSFATKVGPILTAVNPGLGMAVTSIGSAAQRIGSYVPAGRGPAAGAAPQQNAAIATGGLSPDQQVLLNWLQEQGMLRKPARRR